MGATPMKVFASCVLFLNQLLGVLLLEVMVMKRLFRFVFAGHEGVMSPSEIMKKRTWLANTVRTIWLRYESNFDRIALLSTFSDDEFQLLMLEEKKRRTILSAGP